MIYIYTLLEALCLYNIMYVFVFGRIRIFGPPKAKRLFIRDSVVARDDAPMIYGIPFADGAIVWARARCTA